MNAAIGAIAEGVWVLALRTPTLPPATTTNTMIVGADRLVVIEPATPFPDEQRRLDDAIERLSAEGRAVVAVLVTHHHRDHTGYARQLADRLGVPLGAHAETAQRVDFDVDEAIADGWTLALGGEHELEAVFTPGHAPGHLVYLDRGSGIGHAGDLVAGIGTILIDPADDGDMAAYLASLRGLLQRVHDAAPPMRLVPAHGPVIDDPAALLEHYVAHRLAREQKVVDAIAAGARDMEALLRIAYADTPRELWPLARLSLEAHLRKLVSEARIEREGARIRPSATSGSP